MKTKNIIGVFYVLSKERIKELSKNGNSILLIRLQKFDINPIGFTEISKTIAGIPAIN